MNKRKLELFVSSILFAILFSYFISLEHNVALDLINIVFNIGVFCSVMVLVFCVLTTYQNSDSLFAGFDSRTIIVRNSLLTIAVLVVWLYTMPVIHIAVQNILVLFI